MKKGITSAAQLKGKSLATPSLGNTQDVALRYWLKQHGLTTTPTGGGDVAIKPIKPNSAAVLEFQSGQIDGGWEPEPYATEMVLDGGTRLVNEASLWPGGQFVTTNLVVTQSFLKAHPSTVNGLLKGQIQANSYINANGTAAASVANAELTKLLGKGLKPNVLAAALPYIHFTDNPIASSLAADAQHAVAVGPAHAGEEPVRHLRPRPAQRTAESGRATTGEFMSLDQRQAAPPGHLPGASARSGTMTDSLDGADGTTAISISEVSKAFGHGKTTVHALDRVSLDVTLGEFVCLIGASGCGKSTLLSLVAGLDTPTAGTIGTFGRKVALMFQEPALFPWLTAAKNVELALRPSGMARKARRDRAAELLEAVHLDGFGDKRPHELSGGMRQRVAMARALATSADVLLMDEPFGALDAMTRDLLHDELDRICMDRGLTVLFVTHNVREAVRLGDRVVVLSSRPGRVIDEFAVPIPGPRRIDSPQVAELAGKITDRLREEMGRHGQAH